MLKLLVIAKENGIQVKNDKIKKIDVERLISAYIGEATAAIKFSRNNAEESILDFPKSNLNEKIFDKEYNMNEYLRGTVIDDASYLLSSIGLKLTDMMFYGGSASFQYHENADIDISVYANWDNATVSIEEAQEKIKEYEKIYFGHPVHFFLKSPSDEVSEVSEAVYDVLNDKWVKFPDKIDIDPFEEFDKMIEVAEKEADSIGLAINRVERHQEIVKQLTVEKETSLNKEKVQSEIDKHQAEVDKLKLTLETTLEYLREKRNKLHVKLKSQDKKEKLRAYQEEITWKYLDKVGYLDIIHKLVKASVRFMPQF